jgi:hypothetical protein
MVAELLAGLEASPLAAGLRGSVWPYPLVNAAHIVGIALLFGAIVPLDLRLMGLFKDVEAATLSRLLVPVAAIGLALAIAAGSLLFITDARDYFASNLFRAKMIVLLLALANIVLAFRLSRRTGAGSAACLRVAAATSIGLWVTVIVLGRLVGYF